jgi:hypothetical protein
MPISTSTSTSPSPLPFYAFPHLLDLILQHADFATLCAFRQTARHFKARVEAELSELVITASSPGDGERPPPTPLTDESEPATISLHAARGRSLVHYNATHEARRCERGYKNVRPEYTPRTIGFISSEDASSLAPLAITSFLLTITIKGDCVGRHRLLYGALDVLRHRPNVSLHIEPDAEGNVSQMAWPSPWDVVLHRYGAVNWWSGAFMYDAPRVVYVVDRSEGEGDKILGRGIQCGPKVRQLVFDFTAWSPPLPGPPGDEHEPEQDSSPSPSPSTCSRTKHLAARAASLIAPDRTIVFRGLDRVVPEWLGLDATTDSNIVSVSVSSKDLILRSLASVRQQNLVVTDTSSDGLCLLLEPVAELPTKTNAFHQAKTSLRHFARFLLATLSTHPAKLSAVWTMPESLTA